MEFQDLDTSAPICAGTRPHLIVVAGSAPGSSRAFIRHLVRGAAGVRAGSIHAGSSVHLQVPRFAPLPRYPLDFLCVELNVTESPAVWCNEADEAGTGRWPVTLVALVDAAALLPDFCSQQLMSERYPTLALADARAVADVLTEQVELADVIVVDNLNAIGPDEVRGHVALLRALNPDALILESAHERVAPGAIFRRASENDGLKRPVPGWQRALGGAPFPDAEALHISSLVYKERRPFHPERLHRLFGDPWTGAVRSRGIFWVASRPDWVLELSQAGASRRYRAMLRWWAATLEARSYVPTEVAEFLGIDWDSQYGDRRQELVFVGVGLDAEHLRRRLDTCLLTDEELALGREGWLSFHDPLPLGSDAGANTASVILQ